MFNMKLLLLGVLLCAVQQAVAVDKLEIDECPILKEFGMEKERFDDLKFLCMTLSGESDVSPSRFCQKLDSLKDDIENIEDPVKRVLAVCGEQQKSFCWAACACVVGNKKILAHLQAEENGCETVIEFDKSDDWIYPMEKDFSEREAAIRTLVCRYKYPIAVLEQLTTHSIRKLVELKNSELVQLKNSELVQLKNSNQFRKVLQIDSTDPEILQLLLDIDQVNLSLQPGGDTSFLLSHKLRAGYAYTISRNWEAEKETAWGQAVPKELAWVFKDEPDTESDQEIRTRVYEYVHGDYQSINEVMRAYGNQGGWDETRQQKLIQTIAKIMIELTQKPSVSLVNQEAESVSVPTAYRTKKRQSDISIKQWTAITQSASEFVAPVSFWSTSFYFHIFSSGGADRFIIQRPEAETSLGKPLDENVIEQEVLFSPLTRFKIIKWRERKDELNEDKHKEVVIREDLTVSSGTGYCTSFDLESTAEPGAESEYKIVKAAKNVLRGLKNLLPGPVSEPSPPTATKEAEEEEAEAEEEEEEEEEEQEATEQQKSLDDLD